MRLVGRRSWMRFSVLSVVFAGIAFVVSQPDAGPLIRLVALLFVLFAIVEAVSFVCCLRFWSVENGSVLMPTIRNRRRSIPQSAFAEVELISGGVVRVVHGLASDSASGPSQLPINMFISTVDLGRWLDAARSADPSYRL